VRHFAVAVLLVVAGAASAVGAPAAAAPQDSIAAARDLYTTAGYEDALAMLTRLREKTTDRAERSTIDQYRAFALFALGRSAEAEVVVEGIAAADPAWILPRGEAPPRLATLFEKARERALPAAVRQRLAAARALYAEKRYILAAEAFTTILTLLEDRTIVQAMGADAAPVASLATGFRDLSLAADEHARAVPASPPAAPAPAEGAAAAATSAAAPGAVPSAPASEATPTVAAGDNPAASAPADAAAAPPSATDGGELGIIPPVAIAQVIPRPNDVSIPLGSPQIILLDLVIDETGRVASAEVRQSVNKLYEAQLIAATRGWRYRPATQGGRPVKYARTLEVTLNPRRED
jgi:hypothetical protein